MNNAIRKPLFQITNNDELKNSGSIYLNQDICNSNMYISKDSLKGISWIRTNIINEGTAHKSDSDQPNGNVSSNKIKKQS